MNERELFLSALEIEDPAARQAHLQSVCADDAEMLTRIEALLASHESQSQFLNTPAVEQIVDNTPVGGDAIDLVENSSTKDEEPDAADSSSNETETMIQNQENSGDEIPLGFLQPSTKPDSLGRLAHYEILEVIGRGAFGIVLKAFDEKLQRVVAIKVLSSEMAATSPARKRFLREARSSAAIRHENVVAIYAVDEQPIPYLVMEYIPGKTLKQRLDGAGPLDVIEVLSLGKQIADGLAAAHAQDLIHRDIKPGNILLEEGIKEQVKITDFGLARAADDASMTQSGVIAGTPMYMAPEQALGEKLDQRADLFSFGSVLYQMVSGRPPFRAPSTVAVLRRVAEDDPRPIQEIIPETPDWLCELISHLHAKDPADRYVSAEKVAELLGKSLAAVKAGQTPQNVQPAKFGSSESTTEKPTSHKSTRRAPNRLAQAAMIGIACLIFLGITEATGVTQLASTVIRLTAGSGTLVIETDDPGITVSIDGEEVTIKGAGIEELTLRPGEYKVAAMKDGQTVKQELVSITRNGRAIVRMSLPNLNGVSVGETTITDEGLKHLTNNKKLHKLELTDCRNVTDAGLKHLRGLDNLRVLILDGTSISDEGLEEIAQLTNLEHLYLARTQINGVGLAHLRGMEELHVLDLSDTQITDKELHHLQAIPNLVQLSLDRTGVTDGGLSFLKNIRLRDISFKSTAITDAGLVSLTDLSLKSLNLHQTKISDVGLTSLESHQELQTLSIGETKVSVSKVAALKLALPKCNITSSFTDEQIATAMAKIDVALQWQPTPEQQAFFDRVAKLQPEQQVEAVRERLKLANPEFDGEVEFKIEKGSVIKLGFRPNANQITDISPVRALRGLERLDCQSGHGQGRLEDLSPLQGMKLTYLNFAGTRVADLAPLKGMPLTHLDCRFTGVTDLSPLQGMKLTFLNCFHTGVKDKDLFSLRGMPLSYLDCSGNHITDITALQETPLTTLSCDNTLIADLSPLKNMKLTHFYCSNTKVVDFSPLTKLKLVDLRLGGPDITDVTLKHVASLSSLRRIILDTTKVTANGIAALKIALPKCEIQSDFTDEQIATAMAKIDSSSTPSTPPLDLTPAPLQKIALGTSMGPTALVSRPAEIEGIRRWTIETKSHRENVKKIVSVDADSFTTSGLDGTVRLWDTKTRKLQRMIFTPSLDKHRVWKVPNGKLLVTGRDELDSGPISLWDAKTFRLIRQIEPDFPYYYPQSSPDEQHLIYRAVSGNQFDIHDLTSGKVTHQFTHEGNGAFSWSPDSKLVASAGEDILIKIHSLEDGKTIHEFELSADATPHNDHSLLWSSDSKFLVIYGGVWYSKPSHILVWDVNLGEIVYRSEEVFEKGTRVLWKKGTHELLVFGKEELQLIDVDHGIIKWAIPTGHDGSQLGFSFSPDGSQFSFSGKLFETSSGKETGVFTNLGSGLRRLHWLPDGRTLVGLYGSSIKFWRQPMSKSLFQIRGSGGNKYFWSTKSNRPSATGTWIELSPYLNGQYVWSKNRHRLLILGLELIYNDYRAEEYHVEIAKGKWHGAALSPAGGRVVAADDKGSIKLWDITTKEIVYTLRENGPRLFQSMWTDNGKTIVSSDKKNIAAWNSETGESNFEIPVVSTGGFAINRSSDKIANVEGNSIAIRTLKDGTQINRIDLPPVAPSLHSLAWLDDNRTVVVSCIDGTLRFIDTDSLETVRVIENVSAKGGFNDDGSSYFWELTPHSIRMLDVATGHTETITWLRDDNWLIVTDDGHYRCSPDAERMLVYVVETNDGSQEILSPKEFAKKHDWHNDPGQVRFQE